MKKNGFTLIELMVVAVIIAILLALIIPAFKEASKRSRAKKESKGQIVTLEKPERAETPEEKTMVFQESQRSKYCVEFMFEVDGVKMYRFYDGSGKWNYFTIEK